MGTVRFCHNTPLVTTGAYQRSRSGHNDHSCHFYELVNKRRPLCRNRSTDSAPGKSIKQAKFVVAPSLLITPDNRTILCFTLVNIITKSCLVSPSEFFFTFFLWYSIIKNSGNRNRPYSVFAEQVQISAQQYCYLYNIPITGGTRA